MDLYAKGIETLTSSNLEFGRFTFVSIDKIVGLGEAGEGQGEGGTFRIDIGMLLRLP